MGTVDPHLGPPKSPTGTISMSKWSQRTVDQQQHPVPGLKGRSIIKGSVTPFRGFEIINYLEKLKFSLVFNLLKFA